MKIVARALITAGWLTGDITRLAAETINLWTIKCAEFVTTSKQEIGYAAAWLDAFYHFGEEDEPLIVDSDKLEAKAKRLANFCAANPDVRVMSASERLR